jgi:hypothetical protein
LLDISKLSQTALADYVIQRTSDPGTTQVYDVNTPKFVLNELNEKKGLYPIPTSLYQLRPKVPFAFAVNGLIGCTMIIVVKQPTQDEPWSGVWFAHLWEYADHIIRS